MSQSDSVLRRRRSEDLIHDNHASCRSFLKDVLHSKQVVFELPTLIRRIFFPTEVGEQFIKQEECDVSSGNGATDIREVMQLTECSSECRFTTLIRSGDHDYSLSPVELEIVGDDRDTAAREFCGQSQVDVSVASIDLEDS